MKSKAQKRIDAEIRTEEYAAMTDLEKLERVRTRPGNSHKETARIWAAINGS